LPYAQFGTLVEGGAGIGVNYTFRLNDVFDPDFSGTGQQPLGLDQYAQMYGRYRVHSFSYEVTFGSRSAAPVWGGVYTSPQSTLPAAAVAWSVVNDSVKSGAMGNASGSNNILMLTGKVNIAEVLGISQKEFMSDMDFSATVLSNPARMAYLHIWVIGRAVPAVVDFRVRLYYDIEFCEPVALGLS
jgi:hypothetical protein